MVYRVPIPLYLEMIDGLGSAQRFGLSNQTLDNGFVVFNGAGGRKRLQTILDWFNDAKPPSGVYLKSYSVKAGEFTVEGLQTHVESIRGPDDDGFYHGRCPSCVEKRGGDTGKDHFYANPNTGQVGCFAGCKKKEVLSFFKETQVSSEETVQTTLPTQTLSVSTQNAELVSTERSDSAKDKLQTKAVILEQNVDYLVVQKLKKNGDPGTSHKIMIEELQTFASSFESFRKGQRITIQEHYDALGWDLVKDQGTRAITRRYHPYIAALYALGEIDVYKDGSIERRI